MTVVRRGRGCMARESVAKSTTRKRVATYCIALRAAPASMSAVKEPAHELSSSTAAVALCLRAESPRPKVAAKRRTARAAHRPRGLHVELRRERRVGNRRQLGGRRRRWRWYPGRRRRCDDQSCHYRDGDDLERPG